VRGAQVRGNKKVIWETLPQQQQCAT
jgi:hypothetical protein